MSGQANKLDHTFIKKKKLLVWGVPGLTLGAYFQSDDRVALKRERERHVEKK